MRRGGESQNRRSGRKRALAALASLFLIVLFHTSALQAQTWVVEAGKEEAIAQWLDCQEIEGIDHDKTSIAIEGEAIDLSLFSNRGECESPLRLTIRHHSACQSPRTRSIGCVAVNRPDCIQPKLVEATLAHLQKSKPPDIWKRIKEMAVSPTENETDKTPKERGIGQAEKSGEDIPQGLVKRRALLFGLTMLSFAALPFLLLLRFRKPKIQKRTNEKAPSFFWPMLLWFTIGLLARFLLVDPTQTNFYSYALPSDWLAHFPKHGLAAPFIEAAGYFLFGHSVDSIFTSFRLIGAMAAPLLFAIVLFLTKEKSIAHPAAFLLALSPFHLRLSAGDSEHVVMLSFFLLAFVAWLDARKQNRLESLLTAFFASVIFLQSRPEAVYLPAAFLLFLPKTKNISARWLLALGGIGVVAILSFHSYFFSISEYLFSAIGQENQAPKLFSERIMLLPVMTFGQSFAFISDAFHPLLESSFRWESALGFLAEQLAPKPFVTDQFSMHWLPPVLVPLSLIGIFTAIMQRQTLLLRLFIALLLLRLPSMLMAKSMLIFLGATYHQTRYHLVIIVFHFIFAAFGFVTLAHLFHRLRRFGKLGYALLALIALHFALFIPNVLSFRYLYQEESAFLARHQTEIKPNARFHYLEGQEDVKEIELSLRLPESLTNVLRGDIEWMNVTSSGDIATMQTGDLYFESGACLIRASSLQPVRRKEIEETQWRRWKGGWEKIAKRCKAIRARFELYPLAKKKVIPRTFSGRYFIHPAEPISIGLYELREIE